MNFKRARTLAVILLLIAAFMGCAGSILIPTIGNKVAIISVIYIVAAVVVWIIWCRCPHCGKRIFRRFLVAVQCPRCKGELYEGSIQPPKRRK